MKYEDEILSFEFTFAKSSQSRYLQHC